MKIILTADSTFDMMPEIAKKLDIIVFPSYVSMGENSYEDYPDIKKEQLFDYYNKSGKLPQTAAANVSDYTGFFGKYVGDNVAVIHISKSSAMSSCYNNALVAAKEYKNVFVIDSKSISGGSAFLAMHATNIREKGNPEEVVKEIEELRDRIDGGFVIEKLDFLKKGGRCSTVAYLGANLLKLRPEIIIKDGAMVVGKKYRGVYKKCLFDYIDDRLQDADLIDHKYIYINHTIIDDELLNQLIEHIKSKRIFENILMTDAGSAVSCHCGPNTFGFFTVRKQ